MYDFENKKDGWLHDFVLVAVKDICKSHSRTKEMDDNTQKDLAMRIIRNKWNEYTLGDIQLFTDMVIDCKLGDALKSVDPASIMEKLKEYDRLRSDTAAALLRKQGFSKNEVRADLHQVSDEEWSMMMKRVSQPLTQDQREFVNAWAEENRVQYGLQLEGKPNTLKERLEKGWYQAWVDKRLSERADTDLPF